MRKHNKKETTRYKQILHLSIGGIVTNVALATMKILCGAISNSSAILLDGVNSLTDAFSSIATIIGEHIASLRPTKKFPFGYGRVEYITSIVISAIIIAAGIMSLGSSFSRIISPVEPIFNLLTLIILIVSIIAKIILGTIFVKRGNKISSQPLYASGIDALYDAILTSGALFSVLLFMCCRVNIDGYVGAIISIFVIKAGIDILKDAIVSLIGERPDANFTHTIRTKIAQYDEVLGVYDLVIDNFGPEFCFVAANIEVDEKLSAAQINEVTRKIAETLEKECNAFAIIGIYANNTTGEYNDIRQTLSHLTEHHSEILQIHGFFVDAEKKTIDFDMVVDFGVDSEDLKQHIVAEMQEQYPNYRFNVFIDTDFCDMIG